MRISNRQSIFVRKTICATTILIDNLNSFQMLILEKTDLILKTRAFVIQLITDTYNHDKKN